jgi:pyruvate,water dikinase
MDASALPAARAGASPAAPPAVEILWLGDERAGTTELAGGKAASLSRLAAAFRVPPGFVVSVPGTELPRVARAGVTDAYRRLARMAGTDAPAVAVRSSAIDEDGLDASFAGQHDTFLNVSGPEQVWWALCRCVASFGSERARHYRRTHGLPDAPGRVAVLVQALVPADASGVAFSAHPVTGERDQVVVNASWGLGESVVAGTVTPDAYVVGRDGAIRERTVADKRRMTIAVPGGTREVPVPGRMARMTVLDDARARSAAALAVALERRAGRPVDVELAWSGPDLFLLQCRPITTLPDDDRSTP